MFLPVIQHQSYEHVLRLIAIAPTAKHCLAHPDGEIATAKGGYFFPGKILFDKYKKVKFEKYKKVFHFNQTVIIMLY